MGIVVSKKIIKIGNSQKTIDLFNDFFQINELKTQYANYVDTARELKSQLTNQEFRITVVGEYSTGKSTFVNALIGQDILLHAVKETTATVTYIHCVKPNNPKLNKIEVNFTETDKSPLTLDLTTVRETLERYTTTASKEIDVVSEIESVHFYLNIEGIEDNVVFIDTPGLNGVAKGHREVTINEIQKAHASICLFQLRGLTVSELEFLQLVLKYQNSTIFVMNRIDELNEREDRSYDEQLDFFYQQLQESLGDPNGINIDKRSVFGLSSLHALVANDHSIDKIYDTDQVITSEQRKTMWQTSHFAPFQQYLWHEVIAKQKDQLLKRSICERFDIVLSSLQQEITAQIAILSADVVDNDLLKIDEQLEKIDLNKQKNSEKIQNFITNRQRELTKDFKDQITLAFENITNQLTNKVNSETDFDKFYQKLSNNDYGNALAHELVSLKTAYKNSLTTVLQDTYQEATERTEHFVPRISVSNKRKIKFENNINTDFSPVNLASKNKETNNEIKRNKQKIAHFQDLQDPAKLKAFHADASNQQAAQKAVSIAQAYEIKKLGVQPTIKEKSEKYTAEVEHGGWGIVDFFCGKKTVTRTRMVSDPSERNAWQEKMTALKREHTNKKIESETRLSQLKNRYTAEKNNQNENDKKIENLSRKIRGLEDDLALEKKEFDLLYSRNKHEALKAEKFKFINKIVKYMAIPNSDIYKDHQAELAQDLTRNCQLISNETAKYFEHLHTQFKNNLKSLRNKQESKLGLAEAEQQAKKLTELVDKIQKIQTTNIHGANVNAK